MDNSPNTAEPALVMDATIPEISNTETIIQEAPKINFLDIILPPPEKIGGQAVIEGVMMRGTNSYAMSVRKTDKRIITVDKSIDAPKKNSVMKLPILRGMKAFLDSMVMGMTTITQSAELAGMYENIGEPSKFEKFLENKLGSKKLNNILLFISVVFAIFLSVGLFMVAPVFIASLINKPFNANTLVLAAMEGIIRIVIFLMYIVLIAFMKDVRRVFEYHGAEHKTINCYESIVNKLKAKGSERLDAETVLNELTTENITKCSRLNKRCGTSFLLFVMIISMLVFMFIQTKVVWLRVLSRVLLVPFIAGLSYEVVVKWAGRSKSMLVAIISYPGMCLQKLTTKEPDAEQIEVAVTALKKVLTTPAASGQESVKAIVKQL